MKKVKRFFIIRHNKFLNKHYDFTKYNGEETRFFLTQEEAFECVKKLMHNGYCFSEAKIEARWVV